jgi:hypothetical protein
MIITLAFKIKTTYLILEILKIFNKNKILKQKMTQLIIVQKN